MSRKKMEPVVQNILNVLGRVCEEHLGEEYWELSQKILLRLSNDQTMLAKISRGKPESWGAGILTVLGRINFLSDASFEPTMTLKQLAKHCGVSSSTAASKADMISDKLEPDFYDYQTAFIRENIGQMFQELQGMILKNPEVMSELNKTFENENPTDLIQQIEQAIDSYNSSQTEGSPVHFIESEMTYQIKITLKGLKPPVWRRIQTPDMPLDILSHTIMQAMGWFGGHLHHFEVGHDYFGDSDILDDVEEESEFSLSDLYPAYQTKPMKFIYLYDFGDSWEHEIVIEKQFEATQDLNSPRCIAGKNACPPEDCGGVWGYADLLEAKKDPKNSEYDDFIDLEDIDPEAFDLEYINERLKAIRRVDDQGNPPELFL